MNVYTTRIEGADEAHQWYAWGEDEPRTRARLVTGMTHAFERAGANDNRAVLAVAVALDVLSGARADEIAEEESPLLPAEVEHFRQAFDAAITPLRVAGHDWVWL